MLLPITAQAKTVTIQTPLGDIEIELLETEAPNTVANFLQYIESNRYDKTFIHRSARKADNSGFVIQGGGFTYDMALPLGTVPARPAVVNEPVYSNVRGSIAMAKVGGNPNSATSQWFFNLANNAGNLDFQNEGFTVFGEVVGNGMDVVDAIAVAVQADVDCVGVPEQVVKVAEDLRVGEVAGKHHRLFQQAILALLGEWDEGRGFDPDPLEQLVQLRWRFRTDWRNIT